MATTESAIQQRIRLAASKLGYVLWRNNRGALKDKNGRLVRYGVGPDGAGDLIGYAPITITEDMVGMTIAAFVNIEVKRPDHKTNKERLQNQLDFIDRTNDRGGIAAMLMSESELQPPAQAFLKSRR